MSSESNCSSAVEFRSTQEEVIQASVFIDESLVQSVRQRRTRRVKEGWRQGGLGRILVTPLAVSGQHSDVGAQAVRRD